MSRTQAVFNFLLIMAAPFAIGYLVINLAEVFEHLAMLASIGVLLLIAISKTFYDRGRAW